MSKDWGKTAPWNDRTLVPAPAVIPDGLSPYIADSIREGKKARAQLAVPKREFPRRSPSQAQLMAQTPEWKAAQAEGMRPKTLEEQYAHLKQWGEKRAERSRNTGHRRRARLRGVEVEHFKRSEIIERDGRICHLCGRKELGDSEIHLDHLDPISRGGGHTRANVKVSCGECNIRKGALTLAEYRARFGSAA